MTSTSATPAWTSQELDSIEHAEELAIASVRRSGELGSRRTIWVVRVGDGIYVRSVNGAGSDWYRGTRARQEGRIQAGGVDKDVALPVAGRRLRRGQAAVVAAAADWATSSFGKAPVHGSPRPEDPSM
ncbi:DUF2255 family protein [Streptomyces sp. NPDC050982]|uniref:DUF2255 family protein n=1 Tax=Streptomyces sp. NPDC050982 TaxID=3154746 RepID=UPI0033CBC9CB